MTTTTRVTIIIPLWNGAPVILGCLEAIYAHSNPWLHEVICVDNASPDNAATLIAEQFPQVRLLPQLVNLGFAGGVNAGMAAATGDLFVLLNQDCVVQPNWLHSLTTAVSQATNVGIVGCTILNADGTVNHAGATMQLPEAYGHHLTAVPDDPTPLPVDYVTGAVFALPRHTWDTVGPFDDDFYPAYYEESDYCYRARHHGLDTLYAPNAQVSHLLSGDSWRQDPLKHTANQHRSRYRFISKHFNDEQLTAFWQAEKTTINNEAYLDQVLGRVVATRDTLRHLPNIIQARQRHLNDALTPAQQRQLEVGFTQLWRDAFARAGQMSEPDPISKTADLEAELTASWDAIQQMKQEELALLNRIYSTISPTTSPQAEGELKEQLKFNTLRTLKSVTGQNSRLLAELNVHHTQRMDILTQRTELLFRQMAQWLYDSNHEIEHLKRRLDLLEKLVDYDYR